MAHRVICVPDDYLPTIEAVLFQIEAECRQKEQHWELLFELNIQELLVLLYRHRCEKKAVVRESDQIIFKARNISGTIISANLR